MAALTPAHRVRALACLAALAALAVLPACRAAPRTPPPSLGVAEPEVSGV
jgi:hypothetical protein